MLDVDADHGTVAVPFDHPHDCDPSQLLALLGGKGKSLADLTARLALPVPPGFTIVSAACRDYFRRGWSASFASAVERELGRLETRMGRRFGDPQDPLLLSVRSGAAASMPGMMDTVLNVGLNAATTEGLARRTGDVAFAEDCRRRLHDTYAKALDGAPPPDDPRAQLRHAIEAVFRSWNSPRAQAYRRLEGIADDSGTAVNIQAMVFGNRDERSGTGVVFSRNPSTGTPDVFGDILFKAQGEDVVSGTRHTLDVARLAERSPDIAAQLAAHIRRIEHFYRDMVEVEFTIESGALWMLQARAGKRSPQAAVRIAADMARDPEFPLSREEAAERVGHLVGASMPRRLETDQAPVATGLGASPGVASGRLSISWEDAVANAAAGAPTILARPETSPSDVEGIAAAEGIVTARGGLASHAAVVARGWGKPAVVGVEAMDVRADGIVLGGRRIAVGELLTIDGETGRVFVGALASSDPAAAEMAETLRWLAAAEDAAAPASTPGDAPALADEDLVTLIAIKGAVTPAALAEILGLNEDALGARLSPLGERLGRANPRFLQVSAEGRTLAAEQIAAHRERFGEAAAGRLLTAFHPHNAALKDLVTRWQMQTAAAGGAPGADAAAAPDAEMIEALAAVHAATTSWLATVQPAGLLTTYAARLERAADRVRTGERQYLVSPRVDSYHNVWFELHEYLIRLAGSTREIEEARQRH